MRLRQLLSRSSAIYARLSDTGAEVYTPQQILEEIERGSPIGRQWIEAEKSIIRKLLMLR